MTNAGLGTAMTLSYDEANRVAAGAVGPAFTDRLGTNRASGARFRPYGDEITSTGNDREKFATYNRDGFTGLDYADQRYYASSYGRFNTPDPYQALASGANDPNTPLSWNKYAYVQGDPVNHTDRQGLFLDAEQCIEDPDACEVEDWGGGGGAGSGGDPGGGGQPTAPSCEDGLSQRDTNYVTQNIQAASDISAGIGGKAGAELSATFILAWGCVESRFGTSNIAQANNNFFGLRFCKWNAVTKTCTNNTDPTKTAPWSGALPCADAGGATANAGYACFSADTGFFQSAFDAIFAHNGLAITIANGMPANATPAQLAQAIANGGHCTEGNCLNGGYGKQVQRDYKELVPVINCLFPGLF